jgi:hypothetical protein
MCLYVNPSIPSSIHPTIHKLSQDSVVCIAICYELDGTGFDPSGGRDLPDPSRPARGQTTSCTIGAGSPFPRYSGRGVALTTHPILVPPSSMGRAIPLPPPIVCLVCNGRALPLTHSTYTLSTTINIYLLL